MAASLPLVSIVTPVFNGADHLAECIESVLAQTYPNWDYTIVNNCSTDDSLAIAEKYAARDARIRVLTNNAYLPILANHNHTIQQISSESRYCKMVFADDWIYPSAIEEMVRVAEQNPSVGLVGAFTMDGARVRWDGPPYPAHRVPGREACRNQLMGGEYVFGTMTSLLIRSDLVRKRSPFFNEQNLQADMEACFDVLQEVDFGFVHQVLAFSRHRDSTDTFAANLNSHRLGDFLLFLKYAPLVLSENEYRQRLGTVRRDYHRVLAHNALRLRPKQFWQFHRDALASVGARIDRGLLLRSLIREAVIQLADPGRAIRGVTHWWSVRIRRTDGKRVEKYQQSLAAKETLGGGK